MTAILEALKGMSSLNSRSRQKRVVGNDDDFVEDTSIRRTRTRLNFEEDKHTDNINEEESNTMDMIKEMDAVMNSPPELGHIRFSSGVIGDYFL